MKLNFCFRFQLFLLAKLPVIFKFLCGPEFIKSIFEILNRGSNNNIFRQTIPLHVILLQKEYFLRSQWLRRLTIFNELPSGVDCRRLLFSPDVL